MLWNSAAAEDAEGAEDADASEGVWLSARRPWKGFATPPGRYGAGRPTVSAGGVPGM